MISVIETTGCCGSIGVTVPKLEDRGPPQHPVIQAQIVRKYGLLLTEFHILQDVLTYRVHVGKSNDCAIHIHRQQSKSM